MIRNTHKHKPNLLAQFNYNYGVKKYICQLICSFLVVQSGSIIPYVNSTSGHFNKIFSDPYPNVVITCSALQHEYKLQLSCLLCWAI